MTISIKKSILLSAILITALSSKAQFEDRVVTLKDDTISCKISGLNMFGNARYTTAQNQKTTRITKDEIKEFYTSDRKLWFRKIFFGNNRVQFMRVLERGEISLYETTVTVGSVTNDLWYATKNSDSAVYIKTTAISVFRGINKGKKAFVSYLVDKKPIQDQYIADHNPNIEEIQRLVHWYNTGEQTLEKVAL